MESPDLVEIGYISKPHGVRGELRVVCHNPQSDTLLGVEQVYVGGHPYTVARARPVNGAVLLTLRDVTDRNRADAMRGLDVSVTREQLALEDDEFLLADLEGCEVVLEDGAPYGVVDAIDAGPQDRLVIVDGDVERLLPMVPEFVLSIDLDAARIVVAPPPGLPENPRRRTKPRRGRGRAP